MTEGFIVPNEVVLRGPGLEAMDADAFQKFQDVLNILGIEVSFPTQLGGIALDKMIFIDEADEGRQGLGIATRTWNQLTGAERYLQIVSDVRAGVPLSARDFLTYNTIKPWQRDLVFDRESVSRLNLQEAYDSGRLPDLHNFGAKSLELVGRVLEKTATETEES